MSELTIAYCTARRDCRIEWFFDSLAKQLDRREVRIIIVDHRANDTGRAQSIVTTAIDSFRTLPEPMPKILVVASKPNVWNGLYRLTKEEWFAAASHRNTAICLCETSHIAFVDDLSVLMPGWLDAVYEAVSGQYVGCGAYYKARNMVVENGLVVSFDPPVGGSGVDDRLKRVSKDVSECTGSWLYGCSMVAPLEDLLDVGAFPEYMDGLGAEDYTLGIALTNAGKHLKFDRRMMTFESEELHFVEPPMRRTDKGEIGTPNSKSHAALRLAQSSTYFPNYYEGGIRKLRQDVLGGKPFPTDRIPDRDWYDEELIAEMT